MSYTWSKMCIGFHVKHPLFLSDFNVIWIFPTDFRKMFLYQISWKSSQWEPSCFMRTDGRTDTHTDRHDEPSCRLSQFCEGVWNESNEYQSSISLNILLHFFFCFVIFRLFFCLWELSMVAVWWMAPEAFQVPDKSRQNYRGLQSPPTCIIHHSILLQFHSTLASHLSRRYIDSYIISLPPFHSGCRLFLLLYVCVLHGTETKTGRILDSVAGRIILSSGLSLTTVWWLRL